jgi:hypothetical protein
VARSLPVLFTALALVSAVAGCSHAEAAPTAVTTIPKRESVQREAWVAEADRFAARACDCDDRSCTDAVAGEFVAFRDALGKDDEPALDGAAQRIHNCRALAHAR